MKTNQETTNSVATATEVTGTDKGHGERLSGATLGPKSKVIVARSQRDAIQTFYRDVLGCKVEIRPNADIVWLRNDFYIAMVYGDKSLSASDMVKSLWLELKVRDPLAMKNAILKFGINEIEHDDKKHFYFQAPGGQVFRLMEDADYLEQNSNTAPARPCYGE